MSLQRLRGRKEVDKDLKEILNGVWGVIGLIPDDWEVAKYVKMLKRLKPVLEKEFKVSKVGVFGSFVRNEQTKNSDIDILVEFSEPIGLKFIDLIEFLEEKLGRKIDLAPEDAISPYIKPYVKREVIYI